MDWIYSKFNDTMEWFLGLLYYLAENIYSALLYLMREMLKLITKLPLLSDVPELEEVWKLMGIISLTCVSLIIIYLASKQFIGSNGNVIKAIEMKVIFTRLIYACFFISLSRIFIDTLIKFNNMLIEILVINFDISGSLNNIMTNNFVGNMIASALIIYQMYLAINIMIGYWLRVCEIYLIYVASPVMYTLWVNPSWGGYLASWLNRLVTLVFTQFVQVLIMVLYSKMIYNFFIMGSLSNICLAAASLILMTNTPRWLQRFVAPDNSVEILNKTWKNINKTTGKVRSKINNIKNKK